MERTYDLDERCVKFSAAILLYVNRMPKDEAGLHMGRQLMRSGSAPALHYGEVQGAESQADFIHKMRIALKELRETRNNLRVQFMAKLMDGDKPENASLLKECVELVAIFAASVKTAERNKEKDRK
jgi:four helix bundle protein